MTKCPTCENGKMTITVHVYGSPDGPTKSEIECVDCKGTGLISEKKAAHLNWEKEQWCECGNPSEETTYWADGENPVCSKHCWTCDDCGKLVQVG